MKKFVLKCTALIIGINSLFAQIVLSNILKSNDRIITSEMNAALGLTLLAILILSLLIIIEAEKEK